MPIDQIRSGSVVTDRGNLPRLPSRLTGLVRHLVIFSGSVLHAPMLAVCIFPQADKSFGDGKLCQARHAVNVQLAHEVQFVSFNGLDAERKIVRDFFYRPASCEKLDNFLLAGG